MCVGSRRHRLAPYAVCMALVVAGCSSTSAPSTAESQTTTVTSAPQRASALKPLDTAAFQAVVEDAAKALFVPGAMVLVRTPQGVYRAAFGTTELGAQTPPTADTHFRIASNTKTMTAALIVLLAQDGKLQFSDPVSKYVPDVPNGENITVAELLKMRSGLYGYTADPAFAAALDADPPKVVDTAGGVGHRLPASGAVRARHFLRVQQHQLRAAGSDRREGRRPPTGSAVPGSTVRLRSASSRRRFPRPPTPPFRRRTRTATCTANPFYALADDPYPADMQAADKGRHCQAHRLHQPELVLRHRRRRRHLHGRRPGDVDEGTRVGQGRSTPTITSSG